MDTGKLRQFAKQTAEGADFDAAYTFFYDETNNVRKFHVKKGTFNADPTANFVLGGFILIGERPAKFDFFAGTGLEDQGLPEIKFTHIAWGNFETCLKSKRLNAFFINASKFNLLFHLAGLNLFYYSLVDIVDSALLGSNSDQFHLSPGLKDCLYVACKQNITQVVQVFYQYGYPAIRSEELKNFVTEILAILEPLKGHGKFGLCIQTLMMFLKSAAKNNSLPFIESSEEENQEYAHVLIDSMLASYQRPVYMFPNSHHYFDNESEIVEKINNNPLHHEGKELTNYTFADSTSDVLIQASDIIVGLTGKFYKFLNERSQDEIKDAVTNMNAIQLDNLDYFLGWIERSIQINPGLINYVDAFEERSKVTFIGTLRGKSI